MTEPNGRISRRSILQGAAWTMPVIAAAVAAPAVAATGGGEAGAFILLGDCRLPLGFLLQASQAHPVPAGTTIDITLSRRSGSFNLEISPAIGWVERPGIQSCRVVLASELPAGQLLQMKTDLWSASELRLDASCTLPSGYTAVGAQMQAYVDVWLGENSVTCRSS
ncbi:hypothetical protein JD276_12390 [Leucobacter sp. CSA1]|uniref:Uncharacterized protein n=1 Tax=Leucobacter chromiisoli TaxID=2796471 RepID=A0A934Q985_9MICO|nr:hypothetical protein [Leucobacter chromiisoli]MBK0419833.1 hypothetical protein [Leucobacter chromiisoli]